MTRQGYRVRLRSRVNIWRSARGYQGEAATLGTGSADPLRCEAS